MKLAINNPSLISGQPLATNGSNVAKRKILLVDDEPSLLLLIKSLLETEGKFDIRTAESGIIALDIIRNGFYPEVILADQRMPGMSGAEFLAESAILVPKAVHVLLTGYTDIVDVVDSINRGHVFLFLTKPWDDDVLMKSLQEAFDQHDIISQNRELKAMVKTLTSVTEELQSANVQLEELNQEKTELMSIVAHDLKNPIGTMIGFADMLTNLEELDSNHRFYASQITEVGERVVYIINRMLEVNAAESGRLSVSIETMNLTSVVISTVDLMSPSAMKKNIIVHQDCPLHLPVKADMMLLQQIILNILSNAIKYSPVDSEVWVKAVSEANSKTVLLSVRDSGEGIRDEEKSLLFQKFSRLSTLPTAGEHSTGLGLAIVKKFTELLGGEVYCESAASQGQRGSTFFVRLPQ
jgi:two-component system, sensor histidine kinase and response regulator